MAQTPPLATPPAAGEPLLLGELPQRARERLAAGVWAYFSGGAGAGVTLRANAAAWQELALWPRVLRDLRGGNTRTTLAGRMLAHPILAAPMALQKMAHVDGETGLALAAAAQGAGFVLSTESSTPLETVADAVLGDTGRGPLWFQLYWQPDRSFNRALAERAAAAGYEAIVLTVDAPVQGLREDERRAGFAPPTGIAAVHLHDAPGAPREPHTYCGGVPAGAPTWDDVAWLRSQTGLPLWLKGVLHPQDALAARSAGVAGIIVSNHGGRTLDGAPATAHALPRVRDALHGELPLVVDGGIRRGGDILKALALGASAVLVGRPLLYALAAGGALGVAQALRLLRDELEIAMALSGCRTLADVGPALLAPSGSASREP